MLTLACCQTRCADKVEEYYDVLLRRLDILQQLYTNGDPVDVSSSAPSMSAAILPFCSFWCLTVVSLFFFFPLETRRLVELQVNHHRRGCRARHLLQDL